MEYTDKPKLILELEELRGMVYQSSEYTQKQLQNIDGNLLIGALISFIVALGISFLLKILNYWIPASFLLIILLMIYSLYKILSVNPKDIKGVTEVLLEVDENKLNFTFYWIFNKIMNPFISGIELVLLVTFSASLWLENGLILKIQNNILTILPNIIIALLDILPEFLKNRLTLLFLIVLILLIIIILKVIGLFGSINFKEIFNNISKIEKAQEHPIIPLIIFKIIILFPIILPSLALYITYNIVSDYRFFIIVFLLQLIFIILSASYFSSLSVKKELFNNLTKFSNIHDQINCLILRKDINEERIDKLKNEYLKAKQYEVSVYSSMFVNFYYLSISSVYINRK